MDYDLWQRFAACAPLVMVERHLAAFRTQPAQKTADLAPYYAEIGVTMPTAARALTLPLRAALTYGGPWLAPRVVEQDSTWVLKGWRQVRP
ncbi:MAG: hypothetical protein HC828_22340 [Blastochloris sp.]|nr:hypothetical protein [Blastochloris sp.]